MQLEMQNSLEKFKKVEFNPRILDKLSLIKKFQNKFEAREMFFRAAPLVERGMAGVLDLLLSGKSGFVHVWCSLFMFEKTG